MRIHGIGNGAEYCIGSYHSGPGVVNIHNSDNETYLTVFRSFYKLFDNAWFALYDNRIAVRDTHDMHCVRFAEVQRKQKS